MPSAPPDPGGYGAGSPVPLSGDLADYETRFGGPLIDTGAGNPATGLWKTYFDAVAPIPAPPGVIPGAGNVPHAPNEWLPVGLRLLPDDGGTLLELWGSWKEDAYRIRFRSNPGGVLYPQDVDYAYSAVPGAPFDIVPNPPKEFLRVVLPAMPVGAYDIVLYWGALWGASYVANGPGGSGVLDVVTRTRQQAVYRLRGALPPLWKTGPRSQADEDLL